MGSPADSADSSHVRYMKGERRGGKAGRRPTAETRYFCLCGGELEKLGRGRRGRGGKNEEV